MRANSVQFVMPWCYEDNHLGLGPGELRLQPRERRRPLAGQRLPVDATAAGCMLQDRSRGRAISLHF
jgi:hypothetical protein